MSRRNILLNALGNVIAVPRAFISITGSTNAALMLAQAVYWTNRYEEAGDQEGRDGWFYMTAADWENQIGLSRREQEGARAKLRSLGLMEEGLRGMPAKLYFRVIPEGVFASLGSMEPVRQSVPSAPNVHPKVSQNRHPDATKPSGLVGGNGETTPIDTKNSPKTSPHVRPRAGGTGEGPLRYDAWVNGGPEPIPEGLAVEALLPALENYIEMRRLLKKGSLTTLALERIFKTFSKFSTEAVRRAIEEAITRSWTGFKDEQLQRHEDDIAAEAQDEERRRTASAAGVVLTPNGEKVPYDSAAEADRLIQERLGGMNRGVNSGN